MKWGSFWMHFSGCRLCYRERHVYVSVWNTGIFWLWCTPQLWLSVNIVRGKLGFPAQSSNCDWQTDHTRYEFIHRPPAIPRVFLMIQFFSLTPLPCSLVSKSCLAPMFYGSRDCCRSHVLRLQKFASVPSFQSSETIASPMFSLYRDWCLSLFSGYRSSCLSHVPGLPSMVLLIISQAPDTRLSPMFSGSRDWCLPCSLTPETCASHIVLAASFLSTPLVIWSQLSRTHSL